MSLNEFRLFQKIIKNKVFTFFLFIILFCLSANIALTFGVNTRLMGDAVSRVLPATANLWNFGSPYKDYWEYIPPGFLFFLNVWVRVFGDSIFWLKILQILTSLGIGLLIYFVLRKIFSPFYTLVVGGLSVIALFSPYLMHAFIPAELFGLFFSLAGLVSLMYGKRLYSRFLFSTFLFTFSGQIKDPYGLTVLTIVTPLLSLLISRDYRSFLKAILFILGGFLVTALLIWVYLLSLGSASAYLEVLRFKSQVFDIWSLLDFTRFFSKFSYSFWHARNIIMLFQPGISSVLLVWLFSFILASLAANRWRLPTIKRHKNVYAVTIPTLNLKFAPQTPDGLVIIFYSLGSLIGFTLGGKFDFHYLIQIVLPMYFFWAIIVKSLVDNFQKILKNSLGGILLFPVLLMFLFPKGPYLKSYDLKDYQLTSVIKRIFHNIALSEPETELEDYIASKTNQNGCIVSVYGWSVGEIYFYAKRRPCSRFFIPNIIHMEWQKNEYRESILRSSPEAIIYTTKGADMDVLLFEQEVVNWTKIIGHCYQSAPKYSSYSSWHRQLYLPRYSNDELKICVKQNLL